MSKQNSNKVSTATRPIFGDITSEEIRAHAVERIQGLLEEPVEIILGEPVIEEDHHEGGFLVHMDILNVNSDLTHQVSLRFHALPENFTVALCSADPTTEVSKQRKPVCEFSVLKPRLLPFFGSKLKRVHMSLTDFYRRSPKLLSA